MLVPEANERHGDVSRLPPEPMQTPVWAPLVGFVSASVSDAARYGAFPRGGFDPARMTGEMAVRTPHRLAPEEGNVTH